jgi:hypothetical protein
MPRSQKKLSAVIPVVVVFLILCDAPLGFGEQLSDITDIVERTAAQLRTHQPLTDFSVKVFSRTYSMNKNWTPKKTELVNPKGKNTNS